MRDISSILAPDKLAALRAAYDHDAMIAAEVEAISIVAPQLAGWNQQIGRTFFNTGGSLAPIQRERCLISIIAITGPPVSLCLHIYWGLMEGLSVRDLVDVIGLVGCYGGLPRAAFALETTSRVVAALNKVPANADLSAASVVAFLIREFAPRVQDDPGHG